MNSENPIQESHETLVPFKRGDVYYVSKSPTCGHEQRGGRPAVIVSNDTISNSSGVLEVVYMTLKGKPKFGTHFIVPDGPCINSTILCEQVTSVSVDRVGDYITSFPPEYMEDIDRCIEESLNLNPTHTESQMAKKVEELAHKLQELESRYELAIKDNKALEHERDKALIYKEMYNSLIDRLIKREV